MIERKADTKKPKSKQVAMWIRNHIDEKNIQPGDQLPSQEDLIRMTGLSRSSVRDAIAQLKALGIVESRKKSGLRLVRSPVLLDLIAALDSEVCDDKLFPHVGSFRAALEIGFAIQIFKNSTKQDVNELKELYSKMTETIDDKFNTAFHHYDSMFHIKLMDMTQNKVAHWMTLLFHPFYAGLTGYSKESNSRPKEIIKRSLLLHEGMIRCLEIRDFSGFIDCIQEHNRHKLDPESFLMSRRRINNPKT